MMIEIGKEYRYRNGGKATILTTSLPHSERPVVSMSELGILTLHYPDGKSLHWHDDDLVDDGLVEIIPFADFKKDDPVLVRHPDESSWARRHFSHAKDGMAWCYVDGKTSWSSDGHSIPFAQCRRPTPEQATTEASSIDDATSAAEMAIQARVDAAVAAARERFAKLCESLKSAGEYQYNNGCDDSAAAIRGA